METNELRKKLDDILIENGFDLNEVGMSIYVVPLNGELNYIKFDCAMCLCTGSRVSLDENEDPSFEWRVDQETYIALKENQPLCIIHNPLER